MIKRWLGQSGKCCVPHHDLSGWPWHHSLTTLSQQWLSPLSCQIASCAETALLHCRPFKLQSRSKCETSVLSRWVNSRQTLLCSVEFFCQHITDCGKSELESNFEYSCAIWSISHIQITIRVSPLNNHMESQFLNTFWIIYLTWLTLQGLGSA